MAGTCTDLPISTLELGGMDHIGRDLFKICRDNKGRLGLPAEIAQKSSHILLTAGEADLGDSPNILFVGNQTMFAKLCPEATDTENHRPKSLIDKEFRQAVQAGYHMAIDEGMSYQHISERCHPRGAPVDIVYERFICRWRLKSGLVQLTTYVRELEIHAQTSLPSLTRGISYSPPLPDPSQSSRVLFPTGYQADELR